MKNDFFSYLDGFNEITVIVPNKLNNKNKEFRLEAENFSSELAVLEIHSLAFETKYVCTIDETIQLNKSYTVVDESDNRSFLRIGKVVRTELFDMMYANNGNDLGFTYTKEKTTFKVWSPVAKEIELELVSDGGSRQFIDLIYQTSGIWQTVVHADLEGLKYRYRVRVNEDFKTATDPFGISSTANGEYNYVVDKNNFLKFKNQKPAFSGKVVDAIIYEASIRDLTMSKTSSSINKGKFVGLLEGNTEEGIDYIATLGITHLQLLPIFDFEGVDELNPEKSYNWGYNPSQYNVVEGSYSTDPNDPYKRINELIALIDYIHYKGMRVSMDVVYNHVFNVATFSMERFVPGYFFRYDENGMRTSYSGCKNDVATERAMVSSFIIKSVKYWLETFNISAFRFDLMGLIDVETMNKIVIETSLIDPTVLIYGEGWNMGVKLNSQLTTMDNVHLTPNIAFFNDRFREQIKGGTFAKTKGYAMGKEIKKSDLYYLFTGSALDKYLFVNPNQSINYIECHDNHTFYDRTKVIDSQLSLKEIKDYARLGLSLVILSQGMPFIHAGQCFLRSKKGVENSYKSPDEVNSIDWSLKDKHQDLIETLKVLIEIRKRFKVFRLYTNGAIKKQIKIAAQKPYDKTVHFILKDVDKTLNLFIKNDYESELLSLEKDNKLLFDSKGIVNGNINELFVDSPGIYIFIKE